MFISYSHLDAVLVKPLVDMLSAAKTAPVFFDQESIPPGKRWRLWIAGEIDKASILMVFWCEHSAGSKEVRKEYQAAIHANKDVIPALLDSTPLPGDLNKFQWLDMRGIVGRVHHAGTVQQNSLLQDPNVHNRMARAILLFLAQERR